jgi:hypothetical protein
MDDDVFFNAMNNYREARNVLESAQAKILRLTELQNHRALAVEQQQQVSQLTEELSAKADQLVKNVRQEIVVQEEKLKQRALQLLEQRKSRLEVNLVQARLALAQSYDRLGGVSP